MTIERQHFDVYAGDFTVLDFTVDNLDEGGRLDLTGATVRWEVAKGASQVLIHTLSTSDDSIRVTNALEGRLQVTITSEVSRKLKRGEMYVHFLRSVDDLGQVSTLATGDIRTK